ncbi:sensor histidine kinase [Consotaella aegiceratis]|uniref:sensor histidine kinase n=1 Tax=Consotaella aegiceratis TaxID=3097961 RepID=UPI002F40639F
MNLSLRLSIVMVALVALTAGAVGVLIYKRAVTAVVPSTLQSLRSNAGLVAANLEGFAAGARADVLALSTMPFVVDAAVELETIAPATPSEGSPGQWRSHLAAVFTSMLQAQPHYLELRLIGADNSAMELVRVVRDESSLVTRVINEADLRSRADRPYVAATLALPRGGVYVSRLDYRRDGGDVIEPPIPVLRIATPVRSGSEAPLGLMIIILDMRPILQQLPVQTPNGANLYLVDAEGNYLVHPDPRRAFAFERGDPALFQDDWPNLADIVTTEAPMTTTAVGADHIEYAVAAWPVRLAEVRPLLVLELMPIPQLLAQFGNVARSSLNVGLAAALIAALLAMVMGITFTRPLREIARAVDPAETTARPLPLEAKGEIGVLARALHRYMESETRLGAVINSSVDAVFTTTLDGIVTFWNPAAEKLHGYSAEEAIGANVAMVVPDDHKEELMAIMGRVAHGEPVAQHQTVLTNKDGERRDISLTISPVRNSDGEVVAISKIARDISHILAQERRAHQLQAEAAHASRLNAAGQMAGALAHELRQPLTAVVNYAKSAQRLMSQRPFEGDERLSRYIDKTVEQAQRATILIRRMREFIGNPNATVELRQINDVVEEGLETALLGQAEPIEIIRDYDPDLPLAPVDRVQLQQVIANLVANAVEAMTNCNRRVLTVTTKFDDDRIKVSVGDTGPGLAAEIRGRLFKPFQTTKPKGMGLGLAICQSIIETHGGEMTVVSSETGTTFYVFIPITQAQSWSMQTLSA